MIFYNPAICFDRLNTSPSGLLLKIIVEITHLHCTKRSAVQVSPHKPRARLANDMGFYYGQ
jgi:hypothetical protein